jgi:hypothetical protein
VAIPIIGSGLIASVLGRGLQFGVSVPFPFTALSIKYQSSLTPSIFSFNQISIESDPIDFLIDFLF